MSILFGSCILLVCYIINLKTIKGIDLHPSFVVIDESIDSENIYNDNSVYFIETNSGREHSIDSHQACSIESAGEKLQLFTLRASHIAPCLSAIAYPERKIYVMLLTKTNEAQLNYSSLYRVITSYGNVKFKYLNIHEFSKNTPLEAWAKTDELEKSEFVISHTSDALRYLTLWKFGGTYLDLDVIVAKPTDLRNFACAESKSFMNSAVLNLDNKQGKDIASMFMQ